MLWGENRGKWNLFPAWGKLLWATSHRIWWTGYLYAVFSPVFCSWEHIYASNLPYLIDEISCNGNDHNLYVWLILQLYWEEEEEEDIPWCKDCKHGYKNGANRCPPLNSNLHHNYRMPSIPSWSHTFAFPELWMSYYVSSRSPNLSNPSWNYHAGSRKASAGNEAKLIRL